MTRFVQSVPAPCDPYAEDPLLRSWLDRMVGPAGHAGAARRLAALAADVTGPLRAAHADAEAHPPSLARYDAWGARVDRIETSAGWRELRDAAARHAVVALPYLPWARARWGAGARVVQHALLHLYGPESATFSCPVAMADGAAALLSHPEVDPAVRDAWLPRLTSTDPGHAVTSGQWMTEAQGGSDLSRTGTVARRADAGTWRLTGDKWFCSGADSELAVVLAHPDDAGGARPDGAALSPFLVPRYARDAPCSGEGGVRGDVPAPGVRVHRLKETLGTRALPTAEIGLTEAHALPLGDPYGAGLARMMTMVVVTRVHTAAAAAAGMRRGLAHTLAYARSRQVAGGALVASPLHRATLGTVAVDAAGAFALAGHAFALLGRVEVNEEPAAARELRLVAPLAKLATARLAVSAASEFVECFGGAGYVEESGVPRLLRDAQVLPIWEGTTNVLAMDVLRAVVGDRSAGGLFARLDEAAELAAGLPGGHHDGTRHEAPAAGLAGALRAEAGALRQAVTEVVADPGGAAVTAGARGLALRMAYAWGAALLTRWAADGDEAVGVAAGLWARRWLGGQDIAVQAHRHADPLY